MFLPLLLSSLCQSRSSMLQSSYFLCFLQLYKGDPQPIPGISLRGVAVSRLSHALNAVLVAALMWAGAVSFKRVIKEKENQLAYAIQVNAYSSYAFSSSRCFEPWLHILSLMWCFLRIISCHMHWPQKLFVPNYQSTPLHRQSNLKFRFLTPVESSM